MKFWSSVLKCIMYIKNPVHANLN